MGSISDIVISCFTSINVWFELFSLLLHRSENSIVVALFAGQTVIKRSRMSLVSFPILREKDPMLFFTYFEDYLIKYRSQHTTI